MLVRVGGDRGLAEHALGGGAAVRGIIEGFYGTPWTWQERHDIATVLAADGMDVYVHAPKDDPYHRQRWREPYPSEALDEFERFAAAGHLRLGVTVAPGLTMDTEDSTERALLIGKCRQLVSTGARLVGLLLDDLEPSPGSGRRHGRLVTWLRQELPDEVALFMVPLHYTGCEEAPYLDELVAEMTDEVAIGWTGRHVVNPTVTAADARARAAAVAGRAPLLWDNTPVNDAVMWRRLCTGPLRGRDPELLDEVSGYLANPMPQARASLPALRSAAAWCNGEDPRRAWIDAVGTDRVLAEGCDGADVGQLADQALDGDSLALGELEEWFALAESCEVGGLGPPALPWAEQLRVEAAVGRVACQLLRMAPDEAARAAPLLYVMWPVASGTGHEVLGGRGGLVPALGQDDRSRWYAVATSYRPPHNVVDRLVDAVFARLGTGD